MSRQEQAKIIFNENRDFFMHFYNPDLGHQRNYLDFFVNGDLGDDLNDFFQAIRGIVADFLSPDMQAAFVEFRSRKNYSDMFEKVLLKNDQFCTFLIDNKDSELMSCYKQHLHAIAELEFCGLNQQVYIDLISVKPNLFDTIIRNQDNLLLLNQFNLNSTENIESALADPQRFAKCMQVLGAVSKKIDACLSSIGDNLPVPSNKSRLVQLMIEGPSYKQSVMNSAFKWCMSPTHTRSTTHLMSSLRQHEKYFLKNTGLDKDRSSVGKACRRLMRVLTHAIPPVLIVGMGYGLMKYRNNPNVSLVDKLFPFFSKTRSKQMILDNTDEIKTEIDSQYKR